HRQAIAQCCPSIVDTLRMARDVHPGKKNSLDALCERYQVDNSQRTLHGALLDAQLLAEVYLAMTRGQESLAIEVQHAHAGDAVPEFSTAHLDFVILKASEEELAAHLHALAEIDKASGGACLWKRVGI
ncbi:MAG: exonuclease domain-containing protein, partial [Betaproteobacteria bacterium]